MLPCIIELITWLGLIMKQTVLKLTLLFVFAIVGFLAEAQSEFPFLEKRRHKNIISLHGTMSYYFDGGPVFLETLKYQQHPHRIVPNGIDYLRMLDDKNGFMVSVTAISNNRTTIAQHTFELRAGGFFSASYLRRLAGRKGLEIRGMLGASFMVLDEYWIDHCFGCWESFGYGYTVHDFGLLGGIRADVALPLNLRLSGILQHTEYFKFFKGTTPRRPSGFDRFTRRRLTMQLGLGFSF